jgi:hypothetical protein
MIFALLTLLTALAIATVAGWFSIIGVMAIYAGAPLHALIMGIVLEAGKLVTTSWLYRNWNFCTWKLKAPLIGFTLALMLATSIGVFGFLSKSHLEQGAKVIDNGPRVERIEQQISREKAIITDNERVIGQLDATINSYLGKDRADRSVTVRRSQAPQREQLRKEIEAANKRIDTFSEEKFKLQSEIRALELEVGPIRYIAELMYGAENNSTKNIEGAVKIFTLLIVSTLDPLAIILLIAANHTIMRRQGEKVKKQDPTPEHTEVPPKDNLPGPVKDTDSKEIIKTEEIPKVEEIIESLEIPEKIEVPVIPKVEEIIEDTKPADNGVFYDLDRTYFTPLPRVRTPVPSKVEPPLVIREEEPPLVIHEEPPLVIREEEPPVVPVVPMEESAVIREIRGSQHFIPQKVNEEEVIGKVETEEVKVSTQNTTSNTTEENKEVSAGRPPEGKKAEKNSGNLFRAGLTSSSHKYPRALSWLKEFTRTQHE